MNNLNSDFQRLSEKKNKIEILGARENNLKNINLVFPKNKLIVFTGISYYLCRRSKKIHGKLFSICPNIYW